MIYGNLIYLLIAIVVLASGNVPEFPQTPPGQAGLLFILKAVFFWQSVRLYNIRQRIQRATDYFVAERRFSVLALIFFVLDVYLLDLHYYLGLLPFTDEMPVLISITGLGIFIAYLVIMWLQLKPVYEGVFGVGYRSGAFVLSRLKMLLALIVPWLVLNLCSDLLQLVPIAEVPDYINTPWGEAAYFLVFLVSAMLWFPGVMVWLMGCQPVGNTELGNHIEQFCRRQGVEFRGIYLWPFFEGKVLTAGVVGFVRRFRYLMITPALVEALSEEELEAVLAHEIGHVKRWHLPLYILLFLGFWLFLMFALQPLLYLLFGSRFFYELLFGFQGEPETMVAILTGVPILLSTIVFFRFVFGFFMRNFERQADLHAFEVIGDSGALIRVLEKIAWLSGNVRDEPSWHHFGIGQRVDFLQRCQMESSLPTSHHFKVYKSLAAYFLVVFLVMLGAFQAEKAIMAEDSGRRIAEELITQKIEEEPEKALWHQFMGDLLVSKESYEEAMSSYERSLELDPDNPEALNNLAWLLLTVEKKTLQDKEQALELARRAADLKKQGHILDTLAEAYWQNGMVDRALESTGQAMKMDPGNREYYRKQKEKFISKGNS